MNESKNVWHSFQGCMIAVSPYVTSILSGIASWYFMASLKFHPFVVWSTAVNVGMLTFVFTYMLIKRIGHGNK